jgi:hypothetical protein
MKPRRMLLGMKVVRWLSRVPELPGQTEAAIEERSGDLIGRRPILLNEGIPVPAFGRRG